MRVEIGLCSGALAVVLMATAAWAEFRLSGAQIDAHVSGNTLKVTTKNLQETRGYFTPDGTVKGRENNRDFVGKWRVHDDMLCLDIRPAPPMSIVGHLLPFPIHCANVRC